MVSIFCINPNLKLSCLYFSKGARNLHILKVLNGLWKILIWAGIFIISWKWQLFFDRIIFKELNNVWFNIFHPDLTWSDLDMTIFLEYNNFPKVNCLLIQSFFILIWPDLTRTDLTWSDLTCPVLSRPVLTWPDLTWPDLTLHDLTWPNMASWHDLC